jgi:hypothetical protein
MFRKTSIIELMREELPPISYQKRLCYRTDRDEVIVLYKMLNRLIFNNKLLMPEIEVMPRCRKYWGMCYGSYEKTTPYKSSCKILLMDKWYCKQWLITTLAHEMCHQYQWDVQGIERRKNGKEPIMSHGPSFFVFRDKLKKHGISLKSAHGRKRWFKHQNLFKC